VELEEFKGKEVWVVTMVDGIEDKGMVCEIVGIVEVAMEIKSNGLLDRGWVFCVIGKLNRFVS